MAVLIKIICSTIAMISNHLSYLLCNAVPYVLIIAIRALKVPAEVVQCALEQISCHFTCVVYFLKVFSNIIFQAMSMIVWSFFDIVVKVGMMATTAAGRGFADKLKSAFKELIEEIYESVLEMIKGLVEHLFEYLMEIVLGAISKIVDLSFDLVIEVLIRPKGKLTSDLLELIEQTFKAAVESVVKMDTAIVMDLLNNHMGAQSYTSVFDKPIIATLINFVIIYLIRNYYQQPFGH
ncbi:uncharacterized protein [Rutidosis leptorrhynchoides]|uniref:uncharacterized protein n=1 Tax=Rutidosis leptorrhynchoides TaxID=125765 RepID=UPI003A9A1747